jgi:UDP-N-acetylglucosamine 3-dehydrogenase
MPKIAVLGAGFMGSTHARAYNSLPGVELGGIYAHSGRRAEPLAAELGTFWTDDLARICGDGSVDAIDICLPTPEHRSAAEAAIGAGKHVLLEKPIALEMADADALVDLAASTDKIFMIAHVLRFWPEYVELQKIAASGRYGRPVSGFASRRQPFPAWSELFSRSDLTGGAVIDMMIHDYDMLNWIFGAPKAVTARGVSNPRSQGWDQVQVLIDYDGASALVDGGMMMPESYPFSSRLEVLLETGALEYHFRAGGRSVEMGGGVNELTDYPNESDPMKVSAPAGDPYTNEVAYFVDSVKSGQPATRATPADARLALKVSLAARESLERGEPVALD